MNDYTRPPKPPINEALRAEFINRGWLIPASPDPSPPIRSTSTPVLRLDARGIHEARKHIVRGENGRRVMPTPDGDNR